MIWSRALLIPLFSFTLTGVEAWNVASPDKVGSGISILTHNDLYGNASSRLESVLVLSDDMASTDASLACQAIGESLWSPTSADFLPYLAYQNMSGLYHVADGACANLSSSGLDNVVQSCADAHPVVCTNSAPLANSTSSNNGTEWQIKVNAPSDTDDASSAAYIGYRTKDVFVFQGIPYANPFDRWTYSTVSNQTGDIPALTYQSQCTQAGNVGSEDCLYLNIWTPTLPMTNTTDRSSLKAVMFQIHGGAYTGGTGADPGLAGANLASRGDVVVVTINYRLTTLGFLALDDGATNGNYGIGDQITALQWVRQNIAAFGGDPDRVTIFGQSAGAGSVRALLGSPRAMGLYSAAIMESNLAGWAYADTYSQYYTIQQEVAVAANPILNATNCTDAASRIDCLRQVDAHLLANLSTVARYVVQDGNIITDSTLAVTGNGPAAHVPVMIGFMRDDGASFVSYPNAKNYPGTAGVPDNFTGVLIPAGFPAELTVQAADLYPIQQGTNQSLQLYNATSQAATDAEFRCLDEASAYSAVLHNVWPKAYVFEFNRTYNGYDPNPPVCSAPIEPGYPYGNPSAEYFKCHSGELAYVFGNIAYTGQPDRDGLDTPMSQMVVDRWTAFARSDDHDPNPSVEYLEARGYVNTTLEMQTSGSKWDALDVGVGASFDALQLRLFQWPSSNAPFSVFSSKERCEAWGWSVDFYEKNPMGYNLTATGR